MFARSQFLIPESLRWGRTGGFLEQSEAEVQRTNWVQMSVAFVQDSV